MKKALATIVHKHGPKVSMEVPSPLERMRICSALESELEYDALLVDELMKEVAKYQRAVDGGNDKLKEDLEAAKATLNAAEKKKANTLRLLRENACPGHRVFSA